LEMFCGPGDLVVDPFAGSGAFGEAARQVGLAFIGAEILTNHQLLAFRGVRGYSLCRG